MKEEMCTQTKTIASLQTRIQNLNDEVHYLKSVSRRKET